jgi:tripartite-type tricarboxylate transporter receptor subunit TctC
MTCEAVMHKALLACIAFGSSILAASAAAAQNFPQRPIELVVPLAAGSTTDVLARLLAQHASETLGAQIVVVNRTGAGIALGTTAVAKAPPDGYTILMATVGIAVDRILKPVSYDPQRDLAPITLAATAPMVLLASPKLGVATLQEFLTKYKDSKELTFSSGGTGTLPHIAGELLGAASGIPIRHVPYRGGAPALQDVIAGNVALNFGTPLTKGNIDNGDVRALAVGAPKRVPTLPNVPTFAEAGLPIPELDAGAWFGLLAPAGTPKDIVQKLSRHFNAVLKRPDVSESLVKIGLVPRGTTPEEFAKFLHEEIERWPPIFQRAGIKAAE